MSLILANLDLLTEEECATVRSQVYEQSNHWIRRKRMLPFFSLGAASYLDASLENPFIYIELARSCNPHLAKPFQWLHKRVCDRLSDFLHAPVELHSRLALPGFHLFQAHPAFASDDSASAHWDLQFQKILWNGETPDCSQPLSFTLPVCLPTGGGGLHMWDISYWDAGALAESKRDQIRRMFERQYYPYSLGKLVLHSGLYLHQIAPMKDALAGEERITYQGHALRFGDMWRLYW